MSQSFMLRVRALASVGLLSLAVATESAAQSTPTPAPPTEDQQLRSHLGLGDATGCVKLLGLNPLTANGQDVADELTRLGSSFGNELRAICGPSAVNSASSLGGGLDTLQATKTATQFRFVRRRIDQRLPTTPPTRPSGGRQPSLLRTMSTVVLAGNGAGILQGATEASADGAGLFGELDFGQRDRVETSYESGYEADTKGFSLGVDYLRGRTLAGGWFGRSKQDAQFTRFSALLGSSNAAFQELLDSSGALSKVCGGLSTGGTLAHTETRLGGFLGAAVGTAGFLDAQVGWARREQSYARSVCAIEADPTGLRIENGVLINDFDLIDDIYAGTLTGINTVNELNLSARTGANVGNNAWTFGPRAAITLARNTTAAFAETGRSTVANLVHPVFGNDVKRTLGGPIGLELAFDDQSRTSVLLEAGGELAAHAGAIVPFVSGFLRHEFKDGYHVATAHFVQDRRTVPTRFTVGSDRPDASSLLLGFGAVIPAGQRGVVRVEITRLAYDALFSATTVSVQARVGF